MLGATFWIIVTYLPDDRLVYSRNVRFETATACVKDAKARAENEVKHHLPQKKRGCRQFYSKRDGGTLYWMRLKDGETVL